MGKRNIDNCLGKTRFETKQEAEIEADRIYFEHGTCLFVYKCPICQGYHFTKKPKK